MSESFGLDIGRGSIKLVFLQKSKEKIYLTSLGEVDNPASNWLQADDKVMTTVAVAIKELVRDAGLKTKKVVFSLSESDVISRLVPLPPMKNEEIRTALRYEAETFVPYPMDEVQLDGEVVSKDGQGRLLVFVVAARNKIIERYLKLIQLAGLEAVAIEPPPVALARMVWQSIDYTNPVILLDLGEKYSGVTVSEKGQVYFTRAVPVGGESFTRAISSNLGLDAASAEEYKKAYGMEAGELEGKIKNAIGPVFESLADELGKIVIAYKSEWKKDVGLLVISGGGANMPGLSEELVRILGLEVQVASPFLRINQDQIKVPYDLKNEGPRFSLAVGLALREFF